MSTDQAFTQDEQELLAEAAAAVVKRGLAVPTMMFLETMAPMNTVTSSMLYVLSPVWRAALPASRIDAVAKILERREAIPELLRVIDEQEDERRREQRAEKERRRAQRGRRRWFGRRRHDDNENEKEVPVGTEERRGS